MKNELRQSIVGIRAKAKLDTPFAGTGFFVPGGIIVTCAHVLAKAEQDSLGRLRFSFDAEERFYFAEITHTNEEKDVAILRPLNLEVGIAPLPLVASEQAPGHTCQTFGFPQDAKGEGIFDSYVKIEGRKDKNGFPSLQISSNKVTHGFSGAPLWDEASGGVVGMVNAGYDFGLDKKLGDVAFGIPSEVLKDAFPALELNATHSATRPGNLPPGSRMAFGRNKLFVGREKFLQELEAALCGDAPLEAIVVSGMGGLGKTQLATEFAYRNGHRFAGAHWLNLQNPDMLDAEIAACGEKMGLAYEKQPEQVSATLKTWQAEGPRLLVLDNFEASAEAGSLLAKLTFPGARLLVTSRRADFAASLGWEVLRLDAFTVEESGEFFEIRNKGSGKSDKDTLGKLAEALGHLPLALELAASYMEVTKTRPAEYLAELENTLEHESMQAGFFQGLEIASPTKHEQSLLATFELSWKLVNTESAQTLFKMAGYLAPNVPIPLEIFTSALSNANDANKPMPQNPFSPIRAIRQFVTFALNGFKPPQVAKPGGRHAASVPYDEKDLHSNLHRLGSLNLLRVKDGEYSIHTLLAAYARYLNEDTGLLEKLADGMEILSKKTLETGLPAAFAPLREHIATLALHVETAHLQDAGTLWNNLGYYLDMIADYPAARKAIERVVGITNMDVRARNPGVANLFRNLGIVCLELDDLPAARKAFQNALTIGKKDWGKEHPNMAEIYNNLGFIFIKMHELSSAQAAFEHAIRILDTNFGPDHPNIPIALSGLGEVSMFQGNFPQGKIFLEQALQIDEKFFGQGHLRLATRCNDLGRVLEAIGEFSLAHANYERALRILETNLGETHLDIAAVVLNLSRVFEAEDDKNGQRACYQRALAIYEACLPPGHPKIENVKGWLGLLGG